MLEIVRSVEMSTFLMKYQAIAELLLKGVQTVFKVGWVGWLVGMKDALPSLENPTLEVGHGFGVRNLVRPFTAFPCFTTGNLYSISTTAFSPNQMYGWQLHLSCCCQARCCSVMPCADCVSLSRWDTGIALSWMSA
jgi:hypothetical protein